MKALQLLVPLIVVAILLYLFYDYLSGGSTLSTIKQEVDALGGGSEESVEIAEDSLTVDEAVPTLQMIKYVDDRGVVHYTNDPDSVPEKYRDSAETPELPSLNIEDSESRRIAREREMRSTQKVIDSIKPAERKPDAEGGQAAPGSGSGSETVDMQQVQKIIDTATRTLRPEQLQQLQEQTGGK